MDTYRVIVVAQASEDESEERSYLARVPELPGCEASAKTRAEAIEAVERELTAQLENMREADVEPPMPIDELPLDGELTVKVTLELHRELLFQAKVQEMDLEAYLAELLARAAGARRERGGQARSRDDRGDDRGNRRGNRRGGGPAGQRYHNIMENRADFIEYVRQLDQDGGGGGRGRGRGGR